MGCSTQPLTEPSVQAVVTSREEHISAAFIRFSSVSHSGPRHAWQTIFIAARLSERSTLSLIVHKRPYARTAVALTWYARQTAIMLAAQQLTSIYHVQHVCPHALFSIISNCLMTSNLRMVYSPQRLHLDLAPPPAGERASPSSRL